MMEEAMMEAVAERDVGEARRESGMRKVHPAAVPTAATVPTATSAVPAATTSHGMHPHPPTTHAAVAAKATTTAAMATTTTATTSRER
jgi:hypothetical protein